MAQLTIQQAFDLALQHHQAGRLHEAEQIYRQILAQQPRHAEAMHHLGVIAHQAGRHDIAVDLIRRAIALRPNFPEAHYNLGVALKDNGQLDQAIAAFRQVIALRPNYAEAHNNLGIALKDSGQLDEAMAAFRQAIALKPGYAEAHNNLAVVLAAKGQLDQAIAACRQAIALKPDDAEAHNTLGNALAAKGQFEEALAPYRQAIALRPNHPRAYSNLGNALRCKGQLDDAVTVCRQAISLQPNYAEAHNNLGNALNEKGQLEAAIAAYRQAIALRPNFSEIHWNLAMPLLLRGDFEEGWVEYEWRRKVRDLPLPHRGFSQPFWDGGALARRTILLHTEQGFGDTIQFIRYLPLVAERGGRVLVEVPLELLRLLRPLPGVQQWITRGETLPTFDVHCPLMSLAGVFKTSLTSIPAAVPYIQPDAQLVEAWARRLGNSPKGLRVGLAWAGRPTFKNDRTRSLHFSALAPLAAVPGVRFYSLQKGAAAEQIQQVPQLRLIDYTCELHDFADTAALIAQLDLVIAVDTAIVHLAGAMGKPVWVLLPFSPDWRWLVGRADSPWYPTMRLFRQSTLGDWSGVVRRVAEALQNPSTRFEK